VVMWAATTAIVTSVVLAFAITLLIEYRSHTKELTTADKLDIALTGIQYDGPTFALMFAAFYFLPLLAAAGVSRLNRKLHWFAFLTAGLLPLSAFIPLIVQSGQLEALVATGLLGATAGFLAGWIWSKRPQTPLPQPPA
jgi:hypothetical protein